MLAPPVPRAYVPVAIVDIALGDVFRRVGRPLEVGIVLGIEEEVIVVRWYANGPHDRRHFKLLQRRVDREEDPAVAGHTSQMVRSAARS